MQFIKNTISLCIIALAITSCDGIFDKYDFKGFVSSPSKNIGERFDQSMAINAEHASDTIITTGSDRYTAYFASDIHSRNTLRKCAAFLDNAFSDRSAAFAALLGDITDHRTGMPLANDTISRHTPDRSRLIMCAGNHDMYWNQWEEFKLYFGSSTYYFVVKTPSASDLFIVLDSSNGTLGRKQINWLESILQSRRKQHRHCIIMTHTNIFAENFNQFPAGNFSFEETASITTLLSKHKVNYFVNGHVHTRNHRKYNGVNYLTTDQLIDDKTGSSYITMTIDGSIEHRYISID